MAGPSALQTEVTHGETSSRPRDLRYAVNGSSSIGPGPMSAATNVVKLSPWLIRAIATIKAPHTLKNVTVSHRVSR